MDHLAFLRGYMKDSSNESATQRRISFYSFNVQEFHSRSRSLKMYHKKEKVFECGIMYRGL